MNVFKLIEEHGLTLHGDIEHFAELVAQQEREACAKLVEADGLARGEHGYMLIKAATRIRARGET
jgi:predicted deacetylase